MYANHGVHALSHGVLVTPFAAGTNYHKHSGINQHILILQFWKSSVINELHWAKIKVSSGLCPPGCSRGEFTSLIFVFKLLGFATFFGSYPTTSSNLTTLTSASSASVIMSPPLPLTHLPPSFTYKDPCDHMGSTQII